MSPALLKKGLPLLGSFEENILNNRLEPIRTVDGYTAELRASCNRFQPKPLRSGVRVSFFSAGDCFPYLGQVHIGNRGYKIPKKGTLQVALFNPLGTLVKLFLLMYDLRDMPQNSQTFLRQTTFTQTSSKVGKIQPSQRQTDDENVNKLIRRVHYLIQLNIISSKSGRIYLNKDVRIFISKKVDLETASQLSEQEYELKALDEMPKNPRYFER